MGRVVYERGLFRSAGCGMIEVFMNGTGFSAKQAVAGGLLINYFAHEGTDDSKPAIVFLHGWRSRASVWLPTARGLSLSSDMYALDLPGFGASELPREAFGVGDYARVAEAFVRAHDIRRAVVVGHSFGGRVAIKLAASHPDFLKGIVLADSAGFLDATFTKKFMAHAAKPFSPLMRRPAMQGVRRAIYRMLGADDYVATPELTAIYLKIINEDLTEDMKKIRVPALIVWGSRDRETPVSFAERMHGLIPGSEKIIVNGAGHFSFLDEPQQFIKAVRGFISKL